MVKAARAARALRLLMQIQVYRHLYCSRAGPRQLPVPVEPELQPLLAAQVVLATHRFGLVQAVQPLADSLLRLLPHLWR